MPESQFYDERTINAVGLMIAHFRFVRKEDAELTDLQKRLDVFLQGEDARLEEELEAA